MTAEKRVWCNSYSSFVRWLVSGVSRLFLSYFVTSQLFLRNFSNISRFFISHLFLANFTVISHFSFVSQPFPDYFTFYLIYFSFISQLFTRYFLFLYQRSRDVHVTFALFEWYHVFIMDEVGFLYDCLKAGKISKQQAKEILASSKPMANSDVQKASGSDVLRAATFCGVSPQCADAMRGIAYMYNYVAS